MTMARDFTRQNCPRQIADWAANERIQVSAQLAAERRLLAMVASGCALPEVLNASCRFVEQVSTECRCGIYLVDWSSPSFRAGAAPSLPASFSRAICALSVGFETGPWAKAAHLKTQLIVADVESDPLWQASPFRPIVLAHDLRSCWVTPICASTGQVLAVFTILQGQPASPTPFEQDLIAKVTHISSIAIERAQREATLKRNEAFFAEAQRLSSTGSFSWRVATDEITWSEQLYRIFEFDRTVPVTLERIMSRIHPDDVPLVGHVIRRARRAGSNFEHEHRLLMPDRSIKYLHLVAHATQSRDGQLEYIGAVQDVSERRRSEEELGNIRSELARVARVTSLGAMTASIAHEVSQPLAGIVTNASTCLRMLAADPPNIEGARETARRTLRDCNRASDVITQIRALFGKREAVAEAVDLNAATREVIALTRREQEKHRVVLQLELTDHLPIVTGDRVQLQQVILNLLMNAADAMSCVDDRPRWLSIKTDLDGFDHVRLAVKDVGVGFDPQNAAKLFNAFYTTKDNGMGIGLSVSRSIIEAHRGCLRATLNEGPGATFSFVLPARLESCRANRGRINGTNGQADASQ